MAIDGPIALTSCVDGGMGCESHSLCPVAGRWDPVNDAIRDALTRIQPRRYGESRCHRAPAAYLSTDSLNEVA